MFGLVHWQCYVTYVSTVYLCLDVHVHCQCCVPVLCQCFAPMFGYVLWQCCVPVFGWVYCQCGYPCSYTHIISAVYPCLDMYIVSAVHPSLDMYTVSAGACLCGCPRCRPYTCSPCALRPTSCRDWWTTPPGWLLVPSPTPRCTCWARTSPPVLIPGRLTFFTVRQAQNPDTILSALWFVTCARSCF